MCTVMVFSLHNHVFCSTKPEPHWVPKTFLYSLRSSSPSVAEWIFPVEFADSVCFGLLPYINICICSG